MAKVNTGLLSYLSWFVENAPSAMSPFWFCVLLSFYLLLCSALRFRRRDDLQRNFPDRQSLSQMTNVEAQKIVNTLTSLEFPFVFLTSLQFGLFKTYGIPSISQLLQETKQFGTPRNASKRYTDTTVLIQEFADHHPTSERAVKAIARVNYIHSRYIKAGKISNDDLLYTLSVFVAEPIAWVDKYEWRPMSDAEKNALASFWKSVGDSMNISYRPLEHHGNWIDGLQFYEDILQWAAEYEARCMVPATTNKQIAAELVPLLLFYVPGMFQGFATKIIATIMGKRLRAAMMFPKPPEFYLQIANTVFEIRRFVLRYLSPPRPHFMRVQVSTDDADPVTNNYYQNSYLAHPYYNKPGIWNRWGPIAWFKWLSGGDLPGSNGSLFSPEGYKVEEVGPASMKGKGGDEMREMEEKIRAERSTGCPFAFRG